MKPEITSEKVKPLLETKFLNVYDLQYEEGKHYFDASRRKKEDLMAVKSKEEFKVALPDAVTCVVVLKGLSEPLLLLSKEYRYPAGQFLLSPPAGLLDAEDLKLAQNSQGLALLSAARREILEETGISIKEGDTLKVINPLLFSTPGMTDESNGFVLAVVHLDSLDKLTQDGAVGSECFDGFCLLTKSQALDILKNGRDMDGLYYSVYTWAALMYFVTDLWA
ncbi:MAG: NUDIX hydrolase [Lachnospiraceae bacterium]|nr:NUDIX hydrolase [Lachnospiraceae bacterium]